MESQKKESDTGAAFRFAPGAKGRALVGLVAAVAAAAFAFLVAGSAADPPALEIAGWGSASRAASGDAR